MVTFNVNTNNDNIDPNDGVLSLREAIIEANNTPEADTIDLSNLSTLTPIDLNSSLPTITQDLTIIGNPNNFQQINGRGQFGIFRVLGATTDLTLSNLTLLNGVRQGDDAPFNRGGNLGAGGALFINQQANVVIDNVIFQGNQAIAK